MDTICPSGVDSNPGSVGASRLLLAWNEILFQGNEDEIRRLRFRMKSRVPLLFVTKSDRGTHVRDTGRWGGLRGSKIM